MRSCCSPQEPPPRGETAHRSLSPHHLLFPACPTPHTPWRHSLEYNSKKESHYTLSKFKVVCNRASEEGREDVKYEETLEKWTKSVAEYGNGGNWCRCFSSVRPPAGWKVTTGNGLMKGYYSYSPLPHTLWHVTTLRDATMASSMGKSSCWGVSSTVNCSKNGKIHVTIHPSHNSVLIIECTKNW